MRLFQLCQRGVSDVSSRVSATAFRRNPPAVLAGCPPTPAAAYGGVKAKGVSAGRRNVADSGIVEGPLARLAALGVDDGRSTPTTRLIPTAGWNGSHGHNAQYLHNYGSPRHTSATSGNRVSLQ